MIRLLELFGGIGTPRQYFEESGLEYKSVGYVEYNKFAVKTYNSLYDSNYESSDIKDVTIDDKNIDILIHGSPCQDFSLAGNLLGGVKGSGTKSSLLWESIRIITDNLPKVIIWENVYTVTNKRNRPVFDAYVETLNRLGYKSYYDILNTLDYGVPQNRRRLYCVSFRNDIKKEFTFPGSTKNDLKLKDFLEDEVDSKYYLSTNMKRYINSYDKELKTNGSKTYKVSLSRLILNRSIASTLTTREGNTRLDTSTYICDDLPDDINVSGVDLNNTLLVKNATKKGYQLANSGDMIDLNYPKSKTRRGRVQKDRCHTLTTSNNLGYITKSLDIRKLTPRECFRLQGWTDKYIDKFINSNSDSQLYKQSGNAMSLNVVKEILKAVMEVLL